MTSEITRLSPRRRSEQPIGSIDQEREICITSTVATTRKAGASILTVIIFTIFFLFHHYEIGAERAGPWTRAIILFIVAESPLLFLEVWVRYRRALIKAAVALRASVVTVKAGIGFDLIFVAVTVGLLRTMGSV